MESNHIAESLVATLVPLPALTRRYGRWLTTGSLSRCCHQHHKHTPFKNNFQIFIQIFFIFIKTILSLHQSYRRDLSVKAVPQPRKGLFFFKTKQSNESQHGKFIIICGIESSLHGLSFKQTPIRTETPSHRKIEKAERQDVEYAAKTTQMSSYEKIEFHFSKEPGELVDLWFWDWAHGRDVCGLVLEDGNVKMDIHSEDGEITGTETITLLEYFKRVKASLDARDEEYRPE